MTTNTTIYSQAVFLLEEVQKHGVTQIGLFSFPLECTQSPPDKGDLGG